MVYDHGKFMVEHSLAPGGKAKAGPVTLDKKFTKLVEVVTGQQITGTAMGDRISFDMTLAPRLPDVAGGVAGSN